MTPLFISILNIAYNVFGCIVNILMLDFYWSTKKSGYLMNSLIL